MNWAIASVHFSCRAVFMPPPPAFALDVSVTVLNTVTQTRADYLWFAAVNAKMTDKQVAAAIASAVQASALALGIVIPTGNILLFNSPTFL